jgi:hypothetical protein
MRYLHVAMFFLFLLCCVVQYNDPDPLTWIALYGYAAALTAMAFFGKYNALPVLGMTVYLIGFFYYAPSLKVNWWHLEEGREAMGLMIAAVWMGVLLLQGHREKGKTANKSA